MIDHDRLFKELISTFFLEFIELFLPQVYEYLEPESFTFLDKEVFTDVTEGDRYETDLLIQAQFRGKPSYFLIHIEHQSSSQRNFGQRMFRYFARLYEKHQYPVYPIVLFSYDQPLKAAPNSFNLDFPDLNVLAFNYRVIQLNRLNWRDFVDQPNPIASALMAKMRIAELDRPKVKVQCLRLMVTLRLNPAKMQLISGFVDTYLRLNETEERQFQTELDRIEPAVQEAAMQIVTSWMERGIEQGLEQGLERGLEQGLERGLEQGLQRQRSLLLRQLRRRLERLPDALADEVGQLEFDGLDSLGEALFDFEALEDLLTWLLVALPEAGQSARRLRLVEAQVGELSPGQRQGLAELIHDQWIALGKVLLHWESQADLAAWMAELS